MTALPEGIHYDVVEKDYRSDPGLNQSTLKAFGAASTPRQFRYQCDSPKEETSSLRIGSFVDHVLFFPSELDKRFAIWKEYRRGKEWTAFEELHKDKVILNGPEYQRATGIIASLESHTDTQRIFNVCRKQVAFYGMHPELCVRMKGLVDLLPDPALCHHSLLEYVFDFKTSADASPEGFAKLAWQLGYDVQAAWYLDGLNACGIPVNRIGFIVVESEPPHDVAIHYFNRFSREVTKARSKVEGYAKQFMACMQSGEWPGYGDGWTEIKFSDWQMRNKAERQAIY
jgi:hypothetical protein